MKLNDIDKIELKFLDFDDYLEIKEVMVSAYSTMPDNYWKEYHIGSLLKKFPDGQVVIMVNGQIAGCALSIIIDYGKYEDNHTGSYSGAVPNEKITWAKLLQETPKFIIESDATIVAPLIFAYILNW